MREGRQKRRNEEVKEGAMERKDMKRKERKEGRKA